MSTRASALALVLALTPFAVFADSPFYGEFSAGKATQDSDLSGSPALDGDDTAVGATLGYQFSEFLAIELAYTDYGQVQDRNGNSPVTSVSTTGYGINARVSLPINDTFSLFGKIGLIESEIEQESQFMFNGTTIFTNDTDSDRNVISSGGARIMLTDHAYITLSVSWFDHDVDSGPGFTTEVTNTAIAFGTFF